MRQQAVVSGAFWNNIGFKPGVPGATLLAGNGQESGDDQASLKAELYKLTDNLNPTHAQ